MVSGRASTLPVITDDVLVRACLSAVSAAFLGVGGVEHHLGDAVAVAQVDEHDAAEVADGVDPPAEL
jgi:hypothetical protein